MQYRHNTILFHDNVELCQPLHQLDLTTEETVALESLCNLDRQSVMRSERAVTRKETYHSLMYERAGNSCSSVIRVDNRNRKMEFWYNFKVCLCSKESNRAIEKIESVHVELAAGSALVIRVRP